MSLLVVMGSGETAPSLVKVHRQVLEQGRAVQDDVEQDDVERDAGPAVLLDTPFAFQTNADELVATTQRYFRESVGISVEVARWRRADAPALERETALALLDRASWAFAGPGSPTYALRQWRGTPVPAALTEVARRGVLVVGSAAACTLGVAAVPVYEVYKVGTDPYWEEGLDVLGALTGLRAAVVPHYDNAEGRRHDTRFCYLGEARLARLEQALPDDVGVLGVDEHTALVVDLAAGTARVAGNGGVTARYRGRSSEIASGREVRLEELAGLLHGTAPTGGPPSGGPPSGSTPSGSTPSGRTPSGRTPSGPSSLPSLRRDADDARARFDAARRARDVAGCVAAVLGLEEALVRWATDSDQNADGDHARRVLRALVVRLGDLAREGVRDPREVLAPVVELLLDLRTRARDARDYATSDLVRDRLAAAGVAVRDTPEGTVWDVPAHGGARVAR